MWCSNFPKKMKDKLDISQSSELKRTEAFNKLVERHQQHKSAIQAALSNVDSIPRNKIVFDDDGNTNHKISNTVVNGYDTKPTTSKKRLLDSDDESDTEINFKIKEQYEGEHGQKLLELKKNYHNDSRFVLDERFIEHDHNEKETAEDVEIEKRSQLKILEDILGKRISENQQTNEQNKQSMIRFDPSRPEHSKFIVPTTEPDKKKIKKKEKKDLKTTNDKVEEDQPIVSKEIFYKVDTTLKDVFEEDKSFSLLGTFGTADDNEIQQNNTEYRAEELKRNKANLGTNPFHYDSTDDEDVADDRPVNGELVKESDKNENKARGRKWWTEPFFFEKNDYRLQEAEDFMKRIAAENRDENYAQLRGKLRRIIKHKVNHQQYKKKVTDKKLGRARPQTKKFKNRKKIVKK